jgi:arsenate reductase (thioredoxin)
VSKTYNVLFLCNGNSARSILAEAILNKEGAGRFYAYSAGSNPDPEVHPATLALLADLDYPMDQIKPESWDDFAREDSPHLDFVFTLADETIGETCPIWPGQPVTAHWGIEDPIPDESEDVERTVRNAYHALQHRIGLFLSLPLETIDQLSLQRRLEEIGGATRAA